MRSLTNQGDKKMAKLTKAQKRAIEMLAIYTQDSTIELDTNGCTEKFYRQCWMCVEYRNELGLEIPEYQRNAADRYEEIGKKRVAA